MQDVLPDNIKAKSYSFKMVIEPDTFDDSCPAFHVFCPALMEDPSLFPSISSDTFPPKTLKSMIEEQAPWGEGNLVSLKLLKS